MSLVRLKIDIDQQPALDRSRNNTPRASIARTSSACFGPIFISTKFAALGKNST